MTDVLNMLEEGDLRSVGKVSEVLRIVAEQPEIFPDLIQAMTHPDPGIRMRASDAVEKISRTDPEYLQAHKAFLLNEVMAQSQQEVRWHLVQIVPRLELSAEERSQTAEKFFSYLEDPSKIVQTNTLQALVDLAWEDDELFPRVRTAVEKLAEEGSPAVSNRAGKLFLQMDDQI